MVKLHLVRRWACDEDYVEDDVYICIDAYDILQHPGTVRGSPGHTSWFKYMNLFYR